MNKQELIAYLDAVCEAESAVQACAEAKEEYRRQKRALPCLTKPQKPVYRSDTFTRTSFKWDWGDIGCSALLMIPIFYIIVLIMMLLKLANGIPEDAEGILLLSAIIAFVGYPAVMWFNHNREENNALDEIQQKNNEWNQTLEQQYMDSTLAYEKEKQIHDASVAMFDLAIRKQEGLHAEAQEKLGKLYDRNIIYPGFQNLIAVYQIREYLKIGICEGLEGPNGAYAQYMEDVRTARICNSIAELRNSLTAAICSLQSTLANTLIQIDSNLSSMRSEIRNSMENLNNQMRQMHNASAAQLESHFNEANRHLATMGQNIAISSHNQYIEQRLSNVDAYLLKMPISL